ncbi:MAG: hypothetical protein KF855_13310 [Acidobacteria bacterium]|nr:hypothetical protein [Acidobacteriota bacterium]
MNDTKNLFIAYLSSLSSFLTAIETRTVITLISAIVLPIVFFAIGKTVDVLIQLYLHNRKKDGK